MTGGQRSGEAAGVGGPTTERVRLDKWLWAARFYKTRTVAADAIESGQVRVDGERVKPAHGVRPGSRITIRKRELVWDVEVLGSSERRGPATEAALLYRETAESAQARERVIAEHRSARAAATGRPTKRDRRRLEDFLNEP
ncbi:MAG TPA: RNA-binding S4 domain-containing protein [Casimicrobiaceae bacterium]|nr:RNA-binding S4 domain-containing protein [Casimicrobiaceae bacterium]